VKPYINTIVYDDYDVVMSRLSGLLEEKGFDVLFQLDMQEKLENEFDLDYKPYTIIGTYVPHLAFKALHHADKLGNMLPYNIVVILRDDRSVEVAASNPEYVLRNLRNNILLSIAIEFKERLKDVFNNL
jgi:uncharacterized protein (DUF302 family)